MLVYAEMVWFDGKWIVYTEKDNFEVGTMTSYLAALNKVSKGGWSLVDIVVRTNDCKYIIQKLKGDC